MQSCHHCMTITNMAIKAVAAFPNTAALLMKTFVYTMLYKIIYIVWEIDSSATIIIIVNDPFLFIKLPAVYVCK